MFGWGRQGPWWNRFSYWPVKELERLNPNLLIVEMGIAASDHDRACEAFYQLFGGTVDYGEEHSKEAGIYAVVLSASLSLHLHTLFYE